MADQGSLVAPAEAGIYSQPTGIFTDIEFLTAAKQVQNPILDDGWELFVECMGVKIHRKYKEVSFRFRVGGLCYLLYERNLVFMNTRLMASWTILIQRYVQWFTWTGSTERNGILMC